MSLQFVLGPSGAGKSHYIYEKIIKESMENPGTNYILLVPEQYSLALQRKMVKLHPYSGTLNIDVIGFNRLAYRVFDELNVKTAKVLEDFGKSMLIRRVAGEVRDKLRVYKNCLNKNGFIDEVKSLMSEFYQYDFSSDKLSSLIKTMEASGDESVLLDKLRDMEAIMIAFQDKLASEYIVSEQLTELLSQYAAKSQLIKNSVIVMDGFTGFTPIQLKLIRTLIACAIKVYSVHTIDSDAYARTFKGNLSEHDLFYLTDKTLCSLKSLAEELHVPVESDIRICLSGDDKNVDSNYANKNSMRWCEDKKDLIHLERNIFRYPYKVYQGTVENIRINSYQTPRLQLKGVCETIFSLVKDKGYRYKDIAIISGNFEKNVTAVTQIFPQYDIPYFLDYTPPVKNNPWVDCIGHILRIIDEDFSYDSVFSFIKSGLLLDICDEDIEELENYVLARGIKGYRRWNRSWIKSTGAVGTKAADRLSDSGEEAIMDDELVAKEAFMEVVKPFYKMVVKKNAKVRDFTKAISVVMETLDFATGLEEHKGLYEKLIEILEKLDNIMGDDHIDIREFRDILDVGLKELNLGMIPSKLDMVTVGDITRTRLDDVKVLFIIDANDGIIPSNASSAGIISEKEKERLLKLNVELAPTDKVNSFVEQFYLYSNMTAPSDKLFISYVNMSSDNTAMSPSYIISRITSLYKNLQVKAGRDSFAATLEATKEKLVEGMVKVAAGLEDNGDINSVIESRLDDDGNLNSVIDSNLDDNQITAPMDNLSYISSLAKVYDDEGEEGTLALIADAMSYSNVPDGLSEDVTDLLKLRMLNQSISKLEQYAKCGYSYFLKYTLGLRERKLYQVDDKDTGNILHTAMESMFRHVHDNMDNNWESLSDEDKDRLLQEHMDEAWDKELGDRELEGGRYEFLKEALCRIGKRTIRTLSDINKKDTLRPEYFEYRFRENLSLDCDNSMTISGVVDRGDASYIPEQDKLRLRIIDYKSGNQKLELNKLYAGIQLQLAIYSNIMIELAGSKGRLDGVTDETAISPDGMYYYRMKDPYIEISKEDELEAKRAKELDLVGMDNDGSGDFEAVLKYADSKAKSLAMEILDGHIEKNPLNEGERSACDYCPYSACCRFDSKYGGNSYKRLKYKNTKADADIICAEIKANMDLKGKEAAD